MRIPWQLLYFWIAMPLLAATLLAMGCTSVREIKFGGGYKDMQGEIVLTLNEVETAKEAAPVLTKTDSQGESTLYTFSLDELRQLREKLLEKATQGAPVTTQAMVSASAESVYAQIKKILRPPVSPSKEVK